MGANLFPWTYDPPFCLSVNRDVLKNRSVNRDSSSLLEARTAKIHRWNTRWDVARKYYFTCKINMLSSHMKRLPTMLKWISLDIFSGLLGNTKVLFCVFQNGTRSLFRNVCSFCTTSVFKKRKFLFLYTHLGFFIT